MSIIREEGVCFFTHDDAKAVIERGIHNSDEAIGTRVVDSASERSKSVACYRSRTPTELTWFQ